MWYRTKDTKKFGKDKIPKNRNCKKFGYSDDKEYRKNFRKTVKFLKNCIVHHIPFNPEQYYWYLPTALKELKNMYGLDLIY